MTRQPCVRRLVAVVLATVLLAYGAPVLADESSLRERRPNEITPTPTPTPGVSVGESTTTDEQSSPTETKTPTEAAVEETEAEPAASQESTSPPIVPVEQTESANSESSDVHVRPKPTPRTYDNPAARPPTPTAEPEPTIPRLDDPVLRWLPEIMLSAEANSVPAELIAGVMRLESGGNPNPISPDGARGLMQIMPDQLLGQGIYEAYWHDPATNIMAGGYELLERFWSYGTWEGAVGSYFGFGCDVYGTCTDVYVGVVFGWAAYYAPIIASPLSFGFTVLPPDWLPPPIVPFTMPSPLPIEEPPPPPEPTETSGSPTPTPTPTGDPAGSPGADPTELPTAVPTDVPTGEPTAEPTEAPTEIPTEVPTEPPTEEPAGGPTQEPPPDNGESGGEG